MTDEDKSTTVNSTYQTESSGKDVNKSSSNVPSILGEEEKKKDEAAEHTAHTVQLGCGVMGRYPITFLLLFVGIGVAVGVGLSYWTPEDTNSKDVLIKWLGLLGDLFLRALKAVVLPIVFVNVIMAVVDMMQIGAVGGVGGKTVGIYLLTTLCAGIMGVFSTLIFARWYTVGSPAETGPTYITLGCNTDGSYLTENEDGTVECTADWLNEEDVTWVFGDVNGTFGIDAGGVEEVSLSDTIYEGVFLKLVTDNIFVEFYSANFAAIVVFAIAMGIAIAKVLVRRGKTPAEFTLTQILMDLDDVLGIMIMWVIMCTPFAVCSLIMAAIGNQTDLKEVFSMVGLLVACALLAFAMQFVFIYCGLYFAFIRRTPRKYLKAIAPAQIMAFASASSAATIPVSISSAINSGEVHETIASFVIPLGATVNMDGSAIYFPCACIWLAIYNGITPTVADYILLVIIATFGSMGTAPVPNASLALIVTAYNTVFNTTGTPDGFSFIFAVDWFMDRCRTVVNVTGDTFVTAIISHICPLDDEHTDAKSDEEHQYEGELKEVTSSES